MGSLNDSISFAFGIEAERGLIDWLERKGRSRWRLGLRPDKNAAAVELTVNTGQEPEGDDLRVQVDISCLQRQCRLIGSLPRETVTAMAAAYVMHGCREELLALRKPAYRRNAAPSEKRALYNVTIRISGF